MSARDDRRNNLLAALNSLDDGTGTLGIIVEHALADDPAITTEDVREIVLEAIADAEAVNDGFHAYPVYTQRARS